MTLYKYGNVYGISDPFNLPGINPRITPSGGGGFHKTGPGMETYMEPDPIPDPFGTDLFDRVQADPKKDNFLGKYTAMMKNMNGTRDANGMPSQGDQELNQRMMQNMMTAHHTGGGVGLDGFKEPSLEDLVEMVREGKVGKEVLGDDADSLLQYGTPSQREKKLEDTGSLEIPVMPFLQSFIDKNIG